MYKKEIIDKENEQETINSKFRQLNIHIVEPPQFLKGYKKRGKIVAN